MDRRNFIKLVCSAALVPSLATFTGVETVSVAGVFAEQYATKLSLLCSQRQSRLRQVVHQHPKKTNDTSPVAAFLIGG